MSISTAPAARAGAGAEAAEPAAAGTAADRRWRDVVAHRGPVLRVLGGPGTGKSVLAARIVVERVATGELRAEQCLILGPTRRAAARLREQVTGRVGATTTGPLARTFASLAFGLLRSAAIREDAPTPYLLSGPEQDAVLRELLAGHRDEPGSGPLWPAGLAQALGTDGFRAELRELLMRAVEHGLDAHGLREIGAQADRPEWVAAADVLAEYDEVTALSRPGAFDPAWLLTAAVDLLESDPLARDELARDLRLVIVDDAQEVTAGGARMLKLLAASGIEVVLLGDPDSAVQTFRGADPGFLAAGWTSLGEGPTVVLDTGYRLPPALAEATGRAAGLIGALGGGAQRRVVPAGGAEADPGVLEVAVFRSAAQEAAHVADLLRRAHLLDGVPWQQMAVIVRGQARSQMVRRVLTAQRVPVTDGENPPPLRDAPATRPLLRLLGAALDRVAHRAEASLAELTQDPDAGWRLDPVLAVDLLTSVYGGADAVTLRRIRRALRRPALAAGAGLPADTLLAAALSRPGELLDLGPEGEGARRIADMLAVATLMLERADPPAEDLIWAMWSAAGLGEQWRATALAGGRAGARADRDLDAVIALLGAAGDFADRLPGSDAAGFVAHVSALELAADRIAAAGTDEERVQVLTPHAAAGREYDVVVVAGVQEGSWPDLRLRGSLLGSEDLVDHCLGRQRSIRSAQAAIRHDEARLFHVAISRARARLHVSAVRDDSEQPSPFLDVIDPGPDTGGERPFTEVGDALDLAGAVGRLRRTVLREPGGEAAAQLAALAEVGVRGAHPGSWWGVREATDARPRVAPQEPVRISPSALVSFGQCQVRHLLTRLGGEGPAIGSAALGTLVHEVIATCGDAGVEVLSARLDGAWARLGAQGGWLERKQRADAEAMLQRAAGYFVYAASQGWRRVAAEESMRVVVGRAQISGIVDRLESDAEGRLRIIDYKTGSSKPRRTEVARHPQLGVYQVAVERGAFADLAGPGATSAGAALVQLGKAGTKTAATSVQLQDPLAADDDPQWAHRLVSEAAEALGGAQFQATVGDWCRTCPVRTSCPAVPEGGMLA